MIIEEAKAIYLDESAREVKLRVEDQYISIFCITFFSLHWFRSHLRVWLPYVVPSF